MIILISIRRFEKRATKKEDPRRVMGSRDDPTSREKEDPRRVMGSRDDPTRKENERYLKMGCSLLPRQAVLVSLLNFIYGDCDKWSWLTSECFSIIYGDPKTTDLGGSCMTPSNYDFDRGCFCPSAQRLLRFRLQRSVFRYLQGLLRMLAGP